MYWAVRVRYACMFALRVEMRRNYRRGKERRGWSSHKRSHQPPRHRRPSHNSRAQRQVRAQRGLSRCVLCPTECAEPWLSGTERAATWRSSRQYFWCICHPYWEWNCTEFWKFTVCSQLYTDVRLRCSSMRQSFQLCIIHKPFINMQRQFREEKYNYFILPACLF